MFFYDVEQVCVASLQVDTYEILRSDSNIALLISSTICVGRGFCLM